MRSTRRTTARSLRIALVVALGVVAACTDSTSPSAPQPGGPDLARDGQQGPDFHAALAARSKHEREIMARTGVEGIGVGLSDNGAPAVVIMTANGAIGGLPTKLDGVPVKLLPTGPFLAVLPRKGKPGGGGSGGGGGSVDPSGTFPRPVPLGVSIGNENECAAGTLGARVTKGGSVYILSNNHVLARQNAGSQGEHILQPGRYDTSPQCSIPAGSSIGTLFQFVTIQFGGGTNTVDAALASTTTSLVGNATFSGGYGQPNHTTKAATVRMAVQKCGRTTGCTHGSVSAINATVTVQYDIGVATFVNQVVVGGQHGAFSKAGDSGSLIVTDDANANPVALLFAGGQTTTIGNPIDAVLQALGVTIDGK
ncbi:MAG TPA: hypothetical protein VN677_15905 [Gemmatimonadaceae bacterium]|jgi:hypothetical protein|nr:hypothetical protein [Gemmatimonadaceae bacterium]